MKFRKYGCTDKKISVLGYGTLRFQRAKSKREFYTKLIREGVDAGINYIDTAAMEVYGSETMVGEAIKDIRDEVYLATKNHYKGTSLDAWYKYFERSLKNLQTDYIDFYHIHALTYDEYYKNLQPSKIIDKLFDLRSEGKIRHICFSSHDTPVNIKKLIDTGDFEGVLLQYNFMDRENEDNLARAAEMGMGVGVMGPIGGGRFMSANQYFKRNFNQDIDIADFALRFVLSNPNVTFTLSGMNTTQMLCDNIKTANGNLKLDCYERSILADTLHHAQSVEAFKCTGCGYCLPCPKQIDIPANFKAYTYYKIWGLNNEAKTLYDQMSRSVTYRHAGDCIKCGACEVRCPQKINIREQFEIIDLELRN